MADVEQDAASPRCGDLRQDASVADDTMRRLPETIGHNVSRTQLMQLLGQGPVGWATQAVEQRQSRLVGDLQGAAQNFAWIGWPTAVVAGIDGNPPDMGAESFDSSNAARHIDGSQILTAASRACFAAGRYVDGEDHVSLRCLDGVSDELCAAQ